MNPPPPYLDRVEFYDSIPTSETVIESKPTPKYNKNDERIGIVSLILIVAFAVYILSHVFTYAYGESTNITGTYDGKVDGKGIYKVENMSVRIISNETNNPQYIFLGFIENISNETLYIDGITIQMYDKNNKLIDYTAIEEEGKITPGPYGKIIYKVPAPVADNSDLDHYVVSIFNNQFGSNNTNTNTNTNTNNPQELYDECVRVAGESFCEFLFRR